MYAQHQGPQRSTRAVSDFTSECPSKTLIRASVMLHEVEEGCLPVKSKGLRSVCKGQVVEKAQAVQVTDALARGTDVIFRVDIQGAQTVRRVFPDAVTLFLVRPLLPYTECHLSKSWGHISDQWLHLAMNGDFSMNVMLVHAVLLVVSVISQEPVAETAGFTAVALFSVLGAGGRVRGCSCQEAD